MMSMVAGCVEWLWGIGLKGWDVRDGRNGMGGRMDMYSSVIFRAIRRERNIGAYRVHWVLVLKSSSLSFPLCSFFIVSLQQTGQHAFSSTRFDFNNGKCMKCLTRASFELEGCLLAPLMR